MVWGLVVETLLCGVSPGMDEGWIPDSHSVPCRAVLVQAAAVDALPERWLDRIGRFDVLSRAPWALQLRGEDLPLLTVELWKDWQGRSRVWV